MSTEEQMAKATSKLAKSGVPLTERHYLWLPELKLAYCRVPKAANSSIRFSLSRHIPEEYFGENDRTNADRFWYHLPRTLSHPLTRKQFLQSDKRKDGWSFSFVRNPVSRLYSCWNNKVMENDHLSTRFKEMGIELKMSFGRFVEIVAQTSDERSDLHVRSQCSFLFMGDTLVPNFIGRVETASVDWEKVQYHAQILTGAMLPDLGHSNSRANASSDIGSNLPRETMGLIAERYSDDFARFYPGYLGSMGIDVQTNSVTLDNASVSDTPSNNSE